MRLIGCRIVIQHLGSQLQPRSSLVFYRQTCIQTLVIIVTDLIHTRLVQISHRRIELCLFITSRNIHIMTVGRCQLFQHQIHPIRITIVIHRSVQYLIFRIVLMIGSIVFHLLYSLRTIHQVKSGIRHCLVHKLGMLPTGIYHVRQNGRFRKRHVTGIRYSRFHIGTCIFGSNQDYTIRSTYTIDSRCGSILQNRHICNVTRVDHIQVHFDSIYQNQRATTVY